MFLSLEAMWLPSPLLATFLKTLLLITVAFWGFMSKDFSISFDRTQQSSQMHLMLSELLANEPAVFHTVCHPPLDYQGLLTWQ